MRWLRALRRALRAFWACSERPRRRLGLSIGNRVLRGGFGGPRRQYGSLALKGLQRAARIKSEISADQHDRMLKLRRTELRRDLIHAAIVEQQDSRNDVLANALRDSPAHILWVKIKAEAVHAAGRYTGCGPKAPARRLAPTVGSADRLGITPSPSGRRRRPAEWMLGPGPMAAHYLTVDTAKQFNILTRWLEPQTIDSLPLIAWPKLPEAKKIPEQRELRLPPR